MSVICLTSLLFFRVVKACCLLLTCSFHFSTALQVHVSQPRLPCEPWLSLSALQHLFWGHLTVTPKASHFQLSTTTFFIPSWDHDRIPGHKSLLHRSQGSLRPAITEPVLTYSHHAASHLSFHLFFFLIFSHNSKRVLFLLLKHVFISLFLNIAAF